MWYLIYSEDVAGSLPQRKLARPAHLARLQAHIDQASYDELLEAARMDGAGEMRIFFQIVLPMLKPVLVTLSIFTFMGAWNDFMWPLIVLTDQEHYTLPVALAALSREHIMDVEMMMAGAVVTVVPVLALFLVLQRYYIQGLLLGSVKG